jgi:tetratricopeptide (TPR) repeat protein
VAAHALATRGLAYARLGEFSDAMREVRKAHEMLRYNDVPVKFADVHIVTAQVFLEIGEIERALEHSRLGVELAIAAGAGDCTVFGLYCSAMGNIRKPDPAAAEDVVMRHIARVHNQQSEYLKYLIEGQLAVARSMADDPEAIGRLEAVLANARALGDDYSAALLEQALADAHMRQGALDRADNDLTRALEYYRRNGMKPYLARALLTLERLRSLEGRDDEAAAAAQEAERLRAELAEAAAQLDLEVGAAVPA